MTIISAPNQFPYNIIVCIDSVDRNDRPIMGREYVSGSGVLIGHRHVLTAGHCIKMFNTNTDKTYCFFGRNGERFSTKIRVSDVVSICDQRTPDSIVIPPTSTEKIDITAYPFADDIGILILEKDVSHTAAQIHPLTPNDIYDVLKRKVCITSYPGNLNNQMLHVEGQLADITFSTVIWNNRNFPGIQQGSSGGPLYFINQQVCYVFSVVSGPIRFTVPAHNVLQDAVQKYQNRGLLKIFNNYVKRNANGTFESPDYTCGTLIRDGHMEKIKKIIQ